MHAYLILAHNEFDMLENLIKALDDARNDLYLHIESKVRDVDFEKFKSIPKKANLTVVPRVSVRWGDLSMVRAEYSLLSAALAGGTEYDYIHLLSGVDIPLKTQEEIHDFFARSDKKEFIHFASEQLRPIELDRVRAYHFATGRRNYFNRFITKAESTLARILHVNRIKNFAVQRGSQWFSITGSFAKYLLEQKAFVLKQFRHTFIPDEFFVQSVFINSPFKDNLYHNRFDNNCLGNMRHIDWDRGSPYVFRNNDYDELVHSPCLFARKFSSAVDQKIIDRLYKRL